MSKSDDRYIGLIMAGYILAPMTALRIWKIGPAELCCLIGCISYLIERSGSLHNIFSLPKISNLLTEFWFVFLVIMFFGSVYGSLVYPAECFPSHLFTWSYLAFISIVTLDALENTDNCSNILIQAIKISAILYLIIYIYSETVSTHLLGANLWVGDKVRFTGGAGNPHQLALPMAVGAVALACDAMNQSDIAKRCNSTALCLVCIYLLWKTDSSTGKMAMIFGFSVLMFSRIKNGKMRVLVVFLLLTIVTIFSDKLLDMFFGWILSDRNGAGRLEIFASLPIAFEKSPLIGLGPGAHGINGTIEFHNTYLEIIGMTGMLGMLVFIHHTLYVLNIVKSNPLCLSCFISLYAFGFAGFAFRRLVYWLVLVFALAIANNTD